MSWPRSIATRWALTRPMTGDTISMPSLFPLTMWAAVTTIPLGSAKNPDPVCRPFTSTKTDARRTDS